MTMKTIEKAYSELVLSNPSWVNPVMREFDSKVLSKSFFIVDLMDFEEIILKPHMRIAHMRRKFSSKSEHMFSVYFELL